MTSNLPSWPVGEAPPWPGEFETLGPHRLFVRGTSTGRGDGDSPSESAVMVHGLGGQSTNWTDLMGLMADRMSSWAPDLPGFGRSPPAHADDYSVDGLTAALAAFVTAGTTPVHVFGNSLGGALAVRLAATRPDLVKSLILTAPALPDLRPRRHTLGVPAVAIPGVGEQIWQRLAKLPADRQVQAMLDLNFGDPSRVSQTRRNEAIAEYQRRITLDYAGDALSKTARGLLRAFLDPSANGLWRQASSLHCPTLVFYGGHDRLVDPRRARRAAATIPGAKVVMLPQVGHVAQMEDPKLVARFVRTFLDEAFGH